MTNISVSVNQIKSKQAHRNDQLSLYIIYSLFMQYLCNDKASRAPLNIYIFHTHKGNQAK
jgi:hypothetical protein